MIKKGDTIDENTLKCYEDIDALSVIEQYLLFKGERQYKESMRVGVNCLIEVGLLHYSLKYNATNKRAMKWYIIRHLQRINMLDKNEQAIIPKEVFDKVEEINNRFRTGG